MKKPSLQEGQLPFEFPTVKDYSKPVVEIHKNGRFLMFKAVDPIAADILRDVKERMHAFIMREGSYWCLEDEKVILPPDFLNSPNKIELWKHLEGNVSKHPFCIFLQAAGVGVKVSETLENYIKKEWKHQQIEDTPFPTPARDVTNSLFERASSGTNLKCIKNYKNPSNLSETIFEKDAHYMVVSTAGNGKDAIRIGTNRLMDKQTIEDDASAFEWTVFHPDMEDYFDDSEEEVANSTITDKYPELIEIARKRIEKINYPLFDHTKIDASMAMWKRGILLCHLMRMSKTRCCIALTDLWGSKKIAIFGSQNVRITWEKEFKKIGVTDYVVVDSLSDLDKPGRYYLMKYGWIRQKKDPSEQARRKFSNYLKPSERHITRKVGYTYKAKSVIVYQYNKCPHCNEPLEKPVLIKDSTGKTIKVNWTQEAGYMCRNKKCVWSTDNRNKKGAAWSGKLIKHKSGTYIDWGLAEHSNCPAGSVKGRICTNCGQTDGTWIPQVTKRFKKKFTCIIPDEIHNIKDRSTLTAEAVYRMKSRRKIGPTGTLLSNSALDAYWVMAWVIGGPRASFPYLYNDGLKQFEDRFCEHVTIERPTGQKDDNTGEEIKKTVSRRLPYLKNHVDWWKFASPKILRRNYSDPMYLASLEKSGMFKPPTEIKLLKVPMVTEQVKLMISALKEFKDVYTKTKEEAQAKQQEINKAFIVSQMSALRIIATVPQFINKRLGQEVYKGPLGGGKLYHVATLAKNKILAGEKVVILSDFIEMQKTVAEELKSYGAIRFDTSWGDEERKEALQSFTEDPTVTCLVAGTRAVSESLDLSVADTCICCDTLWSPATQCQAWSRILTPIERVRSCEIYIVLSDNSIDEHIYNVFYSKLQMSEQAMDHRTINRRAMEINYQWFAERVIQEEANLTIQLRGVDRDESTTVLVEDSQEISWGERE